MEKELFDWKTFDCIDYGVYQFGKVTRKSDGKEFLIAEIDYSEGTLKYYDNATAVSENWKLSLLAEKVEK